MKQLAVGLLVGAGVALAACQSQAPVPTGSLPADPTVERGMLGVKVLWPARTIQTIPMSTEIIRFRVRNGEQVLSDLSFTRPQDDGSPLFVSTNVQLAAATGLIAEAAAYATNPVAPTDVPIASASVTDIRITANQLTTVRLDLQPVVVPTLADFTPKNGGPGVMVTLTGAFGSGGYNGLRLGDLTSFGSLSSGQVKARIPTGATSGPLVAIADGVPSAPGATFSVLTALALGPVTATVGVGDHVAFSVPTGQDTDGQTVAAPTVTYWELVDPARLSFPGSHASGIGTIAPTGEVTAVATGTAWVRAWSGYLSATASLTIQ